MIYYFIIRESNKVIKNDEEGGYRKKYEEAILDMKDVFYPRDAVGCFITAIR